MSPVFIRSDQIQEIVFDVKLRIPEWKVLFAVDGKMNSTELAAFLEMQESSVSATLKRLEELHLLTLVSNGQVSDQEVVSEATVEVEQADAETAEAEVVEAEDEEAEVEESDIEFSIEDEEEFEDEVEQEETPVEMEEEQEEEEIFAEAEEEILSEDLDREEAGVAEEVDKKEEEEDLDELIGNLLEDEQLESEAAEVLDETVEVTPETEEESEEKEFDLGTVFEDEISDAEESLSEMLGDVEEEAVATAPEELEAPPFEEEAEKPEPTHTILVVDDSVVIRKMVEIALENENYNILAVATGKDALKYLDDNDPDLIILDIMLSDVNGLDVLKAIKASKNIPVVMLSAKDTPRETSKAKELGADDFIPKPFKDEELVSKVKELIKA